MWHALARAEVVGALNTSARGLSEVDAQTRLQRYGGNELIQRGAKPPWRILWEQVSAILIVLLLVAVVVSAALGNYKDAAVVLAVVVFNTVLGFVQEYRAEKAIAALKQLAVPTVTVRREDQVQELAARELVPGDVVVLEAGDLVPADCRLLESANLRIQEAALTGEAEPVDKDAHALPRGEWPLAERRNMAYLGTMVAYGRGQAVVTATGMQTELGSIAALIQSADRESTPLQRRLDHLGRRLAVAALAVAGVIAVLDLLRGEPLALILMMAISVAVAMIPEGLPAVVTIALALGAQRMLQRRALIRKLPAVETLGSVSVICSDKTGTLTQNRMTVTVLDLAGHRWDLAESLRHSEPLLETRDQQQAAPRDDHGLALMLAGGALCNDAALDGADSGIWLASEVGGYRTIGDPTEGALVIAAAWLGLWKPKLERSFPRVAEVPFDSERKRMTTVHEVGVGAGSRLPTDLISQVGSLVAGGLPYVAFTKGAVDRLLEVSAQVWVEGRSEALTGVWRDRIVAAQDELARRGMRVLGVAFRPLASPLPDDLESIERDLTFVGLAGMLDPPRPEVRAALAACDTAGIRTVMITGDHPLTAQHIAQELGLDGRGRFASGQELDGLSTEALREVVQNVSVYARVSPENKLQIVQALQQQGHIVAMTGDGVNDAPALRTADIGVAMGITGTDVSKEAADMVLLDDNFATIVAAVEEGRVIYDNIRRFIQFSIAGNLGKVLVVVLAPFLGMPLALLPVQLLWLNLLTDGVLGLGLSVERAEQGTMRRRPYHPTESIFSRGMGRQIVWVGPLLAAVALGVGYGYWRIGDPHWQTMVFTILATSQMGKALASRSSHDSLFHTGLRSNRLLVGAVALAFVLQLAIVYVPVLQGFFNTVALPAEDVAVSLAAGTVVFWAVELEKGLIRRRRVTPRVARPSA